MTETFAFDPFASKDASHRTRSQTLPGDAVDILAREALARLSLQGTTAVKPGERPSDEDVTHLAQVLLRLEQNHAFDIIHERYVRGDSLQNLYLHYLAGAARQIGQWWVDNTATFLQVTTAVGKIFGIMEALRATRTDEDIQYEQELLFAAVPGEDHVLGVRMAADLIRAEGWDVRLLVGADQRGIVDEIKEGDICVVGLSASRSELLPELAQSISAIRAANPKLRIMVSGRIVDVARDQVEGLGPDWIIDDVPQALDLLERFQHVGAPLRKA